MTTHHRRRYLIKRGLQLRYMAVLIGAMALSAALAGALTYIGIWSRVIPDFSAARMAEKLETASRISEQEAARLGPRASGTLALFSQAKLLSAHEQESLASAMRGANQELAPVLAIILAAIGAASLLISHRLAGPVYRLEQAIAAVSAGRLDLTVRLRKGDELSELALALQELIDTWRGSAERTQALIGQLSAALTRLAPLAAQDDAARAAVTQLRSALRELEQEYRAYVVRPSPPA